MKKVLKQIAGYVLVPVACLSVSFTVITLRGGMFYWQVFLYAVVSCVLIYFCWRPFPSYRIKPGVKQFFMKGR